MSDSRAVILAPDVLAAALIDPLARATLGRWRDGEFKVLVNRELLAIHLRVLHKLGLGPELIRRWTYWFTSPTRSVFAGDLQAESKNQGSALVRICETLATEGAPGDEANVGRVRQGGVLILCWKRPVQATNQNLWTTVVEFVSAK